MKNRFGGEYYKFVAESGFIFAVIVSSSNEGPAVQIITKDGSFQVNDVRGVNIQKNEMSFEIFQKKLMLEGKLRMYDFHSLKGKAMGPFSVFSMEIIHSLFLI